jgi:Ca-activated chloride channel family protein
VIDVDQPLVWVDGSWQWRFPTTVAPRYLGADGRVADAGQVAVDDRRTGRRLPARCELDLVIEDADRRRRPRVAVAHAARDRGSPDGTARGVRGIRAGHRDGPRRRRALAGGGSRRSASRCSDAPRPPVRSPGRRSAC